MNIYRTGETIRERIQIEDEKGVAYTPAEVVVSVTLPSGIRYAAELDGDDETDAYLFEESAGVLILECPSGSVEGEAVIKVRTKTIIDAREIITKPPPTRVVIVADSDDYTDHPTPGE